MNLAANANAALYASMIVFTIALLAFTWHLAARAPKVADSREAAVDAREDVLVGAAAAGSGSVGAPVGTSGTGVIDRRATSP